MRIPTIHLATIWTLSALAVGGCMREVSVAEYAPPGETRSIPAPQSAAYSLWTQRSPGNEHRLAHWKLNKGEPIGFKPSAADGNILAIAGEHELTLPQGTYRWVRAATAGDRGMAAAQGIGSAAMLVGPFMLLP